MLSADAAPRGNGEAGDQSNRKQRPDDDLRAAHGAGQADRLAAYGLSNQAPGQPGSLGLQQFQMRNDRFNLLGWQARIVMQQGQRFGNVLTELGTINGQYGGTVGRYNKAAGLYGNAAQQQMSQMNQKPSGNLGSGLEGLGTLLELGKERIIQPDSGPAISAGPPSLWLRIS